jgi:hypothetical protein
MRHSQPIIHQDHRGSELLGKLDDIRFCQMQEARG